ncbi:MAG: peptidase M36, partial [Gemmatimonadetes bacterium]|nr:peptidase M36 [Gemmatimonadota bacterium]
MHVRAVETERESRLSRFGRLTRRAAAIALLSWPLLAASSGGALHGQAQILDAHTPLANLDTRAGLVQPTAAQKSIVNGLGASVRWNRFGTPASLVKHGGYLATGLTGDAVTGARRFVRQNRALFRLSDQAVTNLELVSDSRMAGNQIHAVIFRQRYGSLAAGHDGLITVGIVGGKVGYVSSSATGDAAAPGGASLTPKQAWIKAAQSVGKNVATAAVNVGGTDDGWTLLDVNGFSFDQRARLVAVPTPKNGVRPAFETLVL